MRAFFFLVIALCTFATHADTQNPCEQDSYSGDCEATEVIVQESQGDAAGSGQDQAAQSAYVRYKIIGHSKNLCFEGSGFRNLERSNPGIEAHYRTGQWQRSRHHHIAGGIVN